MNLRTVLLTAAALATAAVPIFAHHSFSAEYDASKPITIKGTVTRFDWTNPHVRFYVETKEGNGNAVTWDLELMSPNTLTRAGWNRHSLKVGDQVTVTAFLAKDGSKRANARGKVTLADGRQVFAGDPEDGGPTK